jgi:hypothetical protein
LSEAGVFAGIVTDLLDGVEDWLSGLTAGETLEEESEVAETCGQGWVGGEVIRATCAGLGECLAVGGVLLSVVE